MLAMAPFEVRPFQLSSPVVYVLEYVRLVGALSHVLDSAEPRRKTETYATDSRVRPEECTR